MRFAWPPGPVHVSVKELGLLDNGALFSLPAVGRVPDHAPLAAHEVASVADQVSAVVPPAATDVGEADKVTTGAPGALAVPWDVAVTRVSARCALLPPGRMKKPMPGCPVAYVESVARAINVLLI